MIILNGKVIRCETGVVRESRGHWRPTCRPCGWISPDTLPSKVAAVEVAVAHQLQTPDGQAALATSAH